MRSLHDQELAALNQQLDRSLGGSVSLQQTQARFSITDSTLLFDENEFVAVGTPLPVIGSAPAVMQDESKKKPARGTQWEWEREAWRIEREALRADLDQVDHEVTVVCAQHNICTQHHMHATAYPHMQSQSISCDF